MNDYKDLMYEEQMFTQYLYIGGIFHIGEYWAFENFAKDINFEFNTTVNYGECIIIEFYSYPLHVFLFGLDCALSNEVVVG